MEIDEVEAMTIPFQLQFDKPIAAQAKIAEWNPEKDLLAMVTEDSKIILHRFNWQRLWMVSSGKSITSLCWRPDGKAIAVGLEDGIISLHDVENGKLLRSISSHSVAVVCLNWEEDAQLVEDDVGNNLTYEDRTSRFFPPAPRIPCIPGLGGTDTGFTDDTGNSFWELSNSSHQRFNILTSGDKEGNICFSIFGIFPIGKINVNNISIGSLLSGNKTTYHLRGASIYKVFLSRDLQKLIVLCLGELVEDMIDQKDSHSLRQDSTNSLHFLLLNTSVFRNRKNELHQVALQASNIEDLIDVVRASLSLMHKLWGDFMHTFHNKFDCLSSLIIDHGLESTPQEEILCLLGGGRTSPPVHQFLVNSLGESGLKRVLKVLDNTGKELHLIVREHLQPAAEMIAFRSGELKGLSRWRNRYGSIGLDEKLVNNASENAGMLLVQVERFLRVLAGVIYLFQNFFAWLAKCIKIFISEPTDQLPPFNSELVVVFLKFVYDKDPVSEFLDCLAVNQDTIDDRDTIERVEELVKLGGFVDAELLKRNLAKEFGQMEDGFKLAFQMPFTTISKKIHCEDILPLFPFHPSLASVSFHIPTAVSFYKDLAADPSCVSQRTLDYICFKVPNDPVVDMQNLVGVMRGFTHGLAYMHEGISSPEAVLLRIPEQFHCVDLSLYKEGQIVLLLNEAAATSEGTGKAWLMILKTSILPFVSLSRLCTTGLHWCRHLLEYAVDLKMERGKVRSIPHFVTTPLAVSASRGIGCVFASRKRALVYILEEDEEEASEME